MGKDVRRIHVENGLSLRFPNRDKEFDEGVEIGVLAVLMSSGARSFTHWVSTANVAQVRALAEGMGYRVTEGEADGALTQVIFRTGGSRPKLTLVHSRVEAGQHVA
jgi:hypothetical protein